MPPTSIPTTHRPGPAPRRRRRTGIAVPVDQLGLDDEAARELWDDLATLARAGLLRPVADELEPTDLTLRFALVQAAAAFGAHATEPAGSPGTARPGSFGIAR